MDYELIKNFWVKRSKSDKFLWRDDLTDLNIKLISKHIKPGYKILDLGAGDGKISAELAKKCEVLAVDYVPDFISKINSVRHKICDIRDFDTDEQFDTIILFGVATHLNDNDLLDLYSKCNKMLKDNGKLLIKHQCGTYKRKTVSCFSEQLQTNYQAIYRYIEEDKQMLRVNGFNTIILDAYPPELNKWPDTSFKFFIASKY